MEKYGVDRDRTTQDDALRKAVEREKLRLARERALQAAKEASSHETKVNRG